MPKTAISYQELQASAATAQDESLHHLIKECSRNLNANELANKSNIEDIYVNSVSIAIAAEELLKRAELNPKE